MRPNPAVFLRSAHARLGVGSVPGYNDRRAHERFSTWLARAFPRALHRASRRIIAALPSPAPGGAGRNPTRMGSTEARILASLGITDPALQGSIVSGATRLLILDASAHMDWDWLLPFPVLVNGGTQE